MHQLLQISLWMEVSLNCLLVTCSHYFKTLPQHLCFPKPLELLRSSQIYYTSAARIQKAALPICFKQTGSNLAQVSKTLKCYLAFNTLPHDQCNGRYFDILIKEGTSSSFSPNTGNVLLLVIVISNQLGFLTFPNNINTIDEIYFVTQILKYFSLP